MPKRFGLSLIVLLSGLLFTHCALAIYTTEPKQKPLIIKVGLVIDDVSNIDELNETLQFNGELYLQWHDARLAFDPKVAKTAVKYYYDNAATQEITSNMWKPHITIMHTRDPTQVKTQGLKIIPDGTVTWITQITAKVETPLNIRNFPFDKQTIMIALRPFVLSDTRLQFETLPFKVNIPSHIFTQEWEITSVKDMITHHNGKPQYAVQMRYERKPMYYVMQILLPMVIIVVLSWFVFWISNQALVNRVGLLLTTLLTTVAFKWIILRNLPHVSYYTYFDVLLLISFITIGVSFVVLTLTGCYCKNERRLYYDRIFRWLFPLLYLMVIGVVSLWFFL